MRVIEKETIPSSEEQNKNLPEIVNDDLGKSLFENGYISIGEKDEVIVDTEKLTGSKAVLYPELKKIVDQVSVDSMGNRYFDPAPALLEYFDGKKVISSEDWSNGQRKPKDLFYAPKTDEEAYNFQAIVEADFHLGFWEINKNSGGIPTRQNYLQGNQGPNAACAQLACLTYNPKFGDARQFNGQLFVRDDLGRMEKVSAEYYKKRGFAYKKIDEFIGSPRSFLNGEGKVLSENGLLKPEWFREMTTNSEDNKLTQKTIDKNGFVMFDGIRYFASRTLKGENAYLINDQIVITANDEEGREVPTFTFSKQEREDLEKPRKFPTLNAEETGMVKFDMKDFHQRRKDETEDQFEARKKPLKHLNLC